MFSHQVWRLNIYRLLGFLHCQKKILPRQLSHLILPLCKHWADTGFMFLWVEPLDSKLTIPVCLTHWPTWPCAGFTEIILCPPHCPPTVPPASPSAPQCFHTPVQSDQVSSPSTDIQKVNRYNSPTADSIEVWTLISESHCIVSRLLFYCTSIIQHEDNMTSWINCLLVKSQKVNKYLISRLASNSSGLHGVREHHVRRAPRGSLSCLQSRSDNDVIVLCLTRERTVRWSTPLSF